MSISRRQFIQTLATSGALLSISNAFGDSGASTNSNSPQELAPASPNDIPPPPAPILAPPGFGVASGPFQPTWESLSTFQVPDWYRDAKFGIWAHWGPQCQPEMGDWYAQRMYMFGNPDYLFHVKKYGHPSKFGFKDVINEWRAEEWEPEHLVTLYKRAGAKYFCAMAHHHDNFDNFDSKYQPWNSLRVGPKKDIVGGWMKATRAAGLRFAISSHGDRAWSWYQAAQLSDPSGPLGGVPYDGIMTREDGKGLWWEGLDPQDLYAQYHILGHYNWELSGKPPLPKAYVDKYFNRVIDLIDKYQPDLLYFDDTVMPLYPVSDIGLKIAAYLYNTNLARNGKLEAVMTGKHLSTMQRKALLLDLERGVSHGGESVPWQTDTCIGQWHYRRSLFEQHKYKTPVQVMQMLIDIVSKNGNLMLNIPLRGNGTIDDDERKVLEALASWMPVHGEAIYSTRPWRLFGEGPSTEKPAEQSRFGGARDVQPYTSQDIRFTAKGETLYAFALQWPADGKIVIKSLAQGSEHFPKEIEQVRLLGADRPLHFTRSAGGLSVELPHDRLSNFPCAIRITARRA